MKYSILLITTLVGVTYAQDVQRRTPQALVSPPPLSKILPGVTAGASRGIKVESIKDDINFWSKQFVDHARYLEVAFKKSNPQISTRAARLQKSLGRFRTDLNTTQSLGKDGNQEYRKMVQELIDLKKEALSSLNAGSKRPSGQNFNLLKALVMHMIQEGEYHMQNLDGVKRSQAEENGFWSRHDQEVADLNTRKPFSGREESRIIDTLMKMGLKDHEMREDHYAENKLSRSGTRESGTRETGRAKPVLSRNGTREDRGQRSNLPGRSEGQGETRRPL